jgi:hypothetical protein
LLRRVRSLAIKATVRFAVVMLIALAAGTGCNRETQLAKIQPPQGWTETTEGNAEAVAALYLDYRERRTLEIHTYVSPTGERLRAITLKSEFAPQSLLGRLTKYRRANKTETFGDLVIDSIDADDERHVGIQVPQPPGEDPDKVVRSSTLLASCLAAPAPTQEEVAAKGPCMHAITNSVAVMKDAAGGSWMYWYIGGLAFAALVIGRRLQLGRRLLPPKGPGSLPEAKVRAR